jgi:FkbM family methyltransferase
MLSQDKESEIVAEFFGDHIGHFLDIGASGGVALSNTYELGLKGWHGLLVEASPLHFQNLISNYTHRGGFKFLNAALWHTRELMKFNYNLGFYSSLIYKEEAELWAAQYWVPTVVADDLKQIQPQCDFCSLDIEAADLLVFPDLIKAYPDCRLWCVEHAHEGRLKNDWHELFRKYRLLVVAETPENFLAAK